MIQTVACKREQEERKRLKKKKGMNVGFNYHINDHDKDFRPFFFPPENWQGRDLQEQISREVF